MSINKVNYISNVVSKEAVRKVQLHVLESLAENLKYSFGPMGSNTCIKTLNAFNQYTKDGYTILKNIHFNGPIEESIKEDLESITRHIVTTVGDGTTSAIILSKLIFEAFTKDEKYSIMQPSELISRFNKVVEDICDSIHNHGRDCTIENIYDICMISTNGNEHVSKMVSDIYKEHGVEVFIDVFASTGTDNIVKTYDGMTLDSGYSDIGFANSPDNTCVINSPEIYFFDDPIDTKEMATFLDAIISTNVMMPFVTACNGDTSALDQIKPTVIIAPRISRDLSSTLDATLEVLKQNKPNDRPPLLVITDVNQTDEYDDIITLCDGYHIKKYIDSTLQQMDIDADRAPTPETITSGKFCGLCDRVVSDNDKTKFINPFKMHNEDNSLSDDYNNLLSYLEDSLRKAKEDGMDANITGRYRRRLNSLKSNLVEFYVGGISVSDRDALRDLVEDAVLNCRSAASHGVGYGANFEGLLSSSKHSSEFIDTTTHNTTVTEYNIKHSIYSAYNELSCLLYKVSLGLSDKEALDNVEISLKNGFPYNLRTGESSGKNVLSSIESDITILKSIAKIVTLMFTCNQFIVPSPAHNTYMNFEEK